jgi:hypothetical protein
MTNSKQAKTPLFILTDQDFVGGAEVNYRFMIPELTKKGYRPIFVAPASERLRHYFHQFDPKLVKVVP